MRNELSEKLRSILIMIDQYYQKYHNLTNDELRDESSRLEQIVSNDSEKIGILDFILPEAFALIKETARRFSVGNIEVKANDFDRSLAEEVDFVYLKGGKAIYLNRWDIGGQTVTWKMVHYDEQLLGGILLHWGYAVEMATGEGKTLVATLPAFLNALTHKSVHIMTVNNYLSQRDFLITRPLYLFYGLTVGCLELYPRSNKRRKLAYNSDITFGTNSSFTFDYLFDHLVLSPSECIQKEHNFAIIDEIDSVLIDNANEPHIVGGGNYYNFSEDYKHFLPLAKEFLTNASPLYIKDELQHTVTLTPSGKKWFENKTGITDLYKVEKTYEIPNYDLLTQEQKKEIEGRFHSQNVIYQLLKALTIYNIDEDYVVENGKIKIIDQNTGRIKDNSRWEYGLHTAIEVKEGVNAEFDFDGLAVISLKNYFKLYRKVCGMSGTIMTVSNELKDVYDLKCEGLPTHKPVIRKDEPLLIYRTSEKKDKAIIERIKSNFNNGRPSLVSSTSIKKSDHIADLLSDTGLHFYRLDAKTVKNEAQTISQAGVGNNITISTNIAGRGTDIKPSHDALENGGLDVIGTELFTDIRIDNQLRGRTGRQGNSGSSVFYASLDDYILKYLSEEDDRLLRTITSSLSDDKLSCLEVRDFFLKAQDNCSSMHREQRTEAARKDDIVSPLRREFYKLRDSLLFDDKASDIILQQIVNTDTINMGTIDNHLKGLYLVVKDLISKSQWNNKDREFASIPFSDNQQTYAIKVNVRKTCGNFCYFRTEYIKQIMLQVFDKEWKKFVLYMMGDLDQREIGMLDKKYNDMLKNAYFIIASRLGKASIPIGHVHNRNPIRCPKQPQDKEVSIPQKREDIDPEALCPCGSGKKYCECHGNGTHNKHYKRR